MMYIGMTHRSEKSDAHIDENVPLGEKCRRMLTSQIVRNNSAFRAVKLAKTRRIFGRWTQNVTNAKMLTPSTRPLKSPMSTEDATDSSDDGVGTSPSSRLLVG